MCSNHNILYRSSNHVPAHGRLIMVSSDARSTLSAALGWSRTSFFRRIAYDADRAGLDQTSSLAILSCSVLSGVDRDAVSDFIVDGLLSIPGARFKMFTGTLHVIKN